MAPETDHSAPAELPEVPGEVQLLVAVWLPGHGWITSYRGVVIHGQMPTIEQPVDVLMEALGVELRAALRSAQNTFETITTGRRG